MYIKNFLLFELLIRNNENLIELKNKKIFEYSKAKKDYLQLKTNQRKLIEYYKANTYLITFESIDNITFEIIENSINLSILNDYLKDIQNNSIIPLKEIERNYLKSYKEYLKANRKQRKQRKKTNNKFKANVNMYNLLDIILNNQNNNENIKNKSIIESIKNNINHYTTIKLNSESIELLNLKFVYYKNNYNLIYNDSNKVLLSIKNIEYNNSIYRVLIYSILLNDNFYTFMTFNSNYDFKFKLFIFDLLNLNYNDYLKKSNNIFSENEKQLLKDIENSKYFYIDNKERLEYFKKQIKENIENIENRKEKKAIIERKLNNNIKYFKQIKQSNNKNKENFIERQNTYKDIIESHNKSIEFSLNSIEYFEKQIDNIIKDIENFESNDINKYQTYFIDYENFEYSFKERKLLNLL